MPTHPASTQRSPDPMPEIGLRDHERRYLRRSLLILCIVFGLLNVIGCRVFISPQIGLGKDGLVRVGYSTYCDEYWPSIPPDPWDWPSPDRCATFRGASPFVSSNYASASDKGMHFTMDVFGCGFPLNAYEIRTIRITKNDGTIVLADPPIGQTARIRVSLIGIGVNTLSGAGGHLAHHRGAALCVHRARSAQPSTPMARAMDVFRVRIRYAGPPDLPGMRHAQRVPCLFPTRVDEQVIVLRLGF